MRFDHDFLVLGAGNAGQAAAGFARRAGLRVAIVERDLVGGTCPNRGCVPKKALVAAAEVVDHVRRAKGHGVRGEASIDWAALQAHRRSIVDPIPARMEQSLASRGITLVRGDARFVGRHEVAVGGDVHGAPKIVIATGSVPRPLTMEGAELVTGSDAALALDAVPRTAVFLGAGVIAFELSHLLSRAGCERIVLLEVGPRPLPPIDADAVEALTRYGAEQLGIEVRAGVSVERIARLGDGDLEVSLRTPDGAHETLRAERVFHGAGRIANLASLDLPAAGIPLEGGRPELRADLRTTADPDVAIVGDAAPGLPQLSPLATSLGALVAKNLVEGRTDPPDVRYVPSCIFSIPSLAQVGLTEARARDAHEGVEVKRTEGMSGWISSRSHHEELAFSKVVLSADGHILGATFIGHGAETSVHLVALAMRAGMKASELASIDTAYPTYASDLRYLL